jgi:hypothetical protein
VTLIYSTKPTSAHVMRSGLPGFTVDVVATKLRWFGNAKSDIRALQEGSVSRQGCTAKESKKSFTSFELSRSLGPATMIS